MRSTLSRRVFRCGAGTAVAGLVLATTSACSVPVDAVAGVSVTDDGHLLGVLLVCGHHIDGATLYVPRDDAGEKKAAAGSWTADHPVEPDLATWTVEAPTAGWTPDGPVAPLAAETTYDFYGWTKDNSSSARHVSFSLADRGRLTPGNVLYDDDGDESMAVVPAAEFKGACADL